MYKYIGIGLLSVFAIMMIPAQSQTSSSGLTLYGVAKFALHDAAGNEVFTQIVHNRLVNEGETFIIDQTFQDGTASLAENASIGSICISRDSSFTSNLAETLSASSFDTNDGLTASNCKEDTTVDDSTQGTAVVAPAAFSTSNLDSAGQTITGIGVCQALVASDSDFANCAAGGSGSGAKLFAAIDTSDVTLNSGETVTVSYTFDITSSST